MGCPNYQEVKAFGGLGEREGEGRVGDGVMWSEVGGEGRREVDGEGRGGGRGGGRRWVSKWVRGGSDG